MPKRERGADPDLVEMPKKKRGADPDLVEMPKKQRGADPDLVEMPKKQRGAEPDLLETLGNRQGANAELIEMPKRQPGWRATPTPSPQSRRSGSVHFLSFQKISKFCVWRSQRKGVLFHSTRGPRWRGDPGRQRRIRRLVDLFRGRAVPAAGADFPRTNPTGCFSEHFFRYLSLESFLKILREEECLRLWGR